MTQQTNNDPMAKFALIGGLAVLALTVGILLNSLINTIRSNSVKGEIDVKTLAANKAAMTEENLKPIGEVATSDGAGDAAAATDTAARSGEEVFKAVCSVCHATGVANAPKLGDKAAWEPRVAQGFDTLLNTAINGKGAMPPRAGQNISDAELKNAIVYMTSETGFNLDVPADKATATADAAPAGNAAPAAETAASSEAPADAASGEQTAASGEPAEPATPEAPAVPAAPLTPAAPETPATPATPEAPSMQAADTASEAAETAQETATEATAATSESTQQAVEAATDTTTGMAEKASDAASTVAEKAGEAADAAAGAVAAVTGSAASPTAPAAEAAASEEATTPAATEAKSDDTAKGEAIYKQTCFACHDMGVAGAPKLGDKELWAPRIATGMDALYSSAMNGKTGATGVMPPKGGNTSLSDADVKAAVDYIVSKAQ